MKLMGKPKTKMVFTAYGVFEVEVDNRPWATEDEDGFIDNGGRLGSKVIRQLTNEEIRAWREYGDNNPADPEQAGWEEMMEESE